MKNLILLAQSDFQSLDVQGNKKKAEKIIQTAKQENVSAVIFPQLFLCGLPHGKVLTRFPQIIKQNIQALNELAKLSNNLKIIIGFIDKNYQNSLAVLSEGKIEKTINLDKNEFYKTEICGKKAGIVCFENGWNENDFDINSEFTKKIQIFVKENNFDFLITPSASISRTGKEEKKHKFLKELAVLYKCKIIYVNATGANDALSFSGMSCVYDKSGELNALAKAFEEQNLIIDLDTKNEINTPPMNLDNFEEQQNFTLNYEYDLKRTYLSVVQAIRGYFKKCGFERAVLGLSGGLDSTVCAVLLTDALGKENVLGISMPSKITTSGSKNDAQELANNLGISFFEQPIKDIFDATSKTFENVFENAQKKWSCRYSQSYTNDNIQARARANILWGVANEFEKCIPIATSDKSEAYMGYATINGDMSGGFAPIADITKTKLFALAKWLNKNRAEKNTIPQSVIEKRPGAELAINPKTGKPLLAEEALMPYEFLDEVIWRIENLNQTKEEMKKSEFVYEKENKISDEQKTQWLDKFFKRMSTAHYKWSISAPAPIIDRHSINSYEYVQPIVSSKIEY